MKPIISTVLIMDQSNSYSISFISENNKNEKDIKEEEKASSQTTVTYENEEDIKEEENESLPTTATYEPFEEVIIKSEPQLIYPEVISSKIIQWNETENKDDCNPNGARNSNEDVLEYMPEDLTNEVIYNTKGAPRLFKSSQFSLKLLNFICPICNINCGNNTLWQEHLCTTHKFPRARQTVATLICKLCSFKSNNRQNMMQHFPTHLPFRRYVLCKICKLCFASPMEGEYHIQTYHRNEYENSFANAWQHVDYSCAICGKPQGDRHTAETHLLRDHNFQEEINTKCPQTSWPYIRECHVCSIRLKVASLKVHLLNHKRYRMFHCGLCNNYKTNNFSSCTAHIKKIHLASNNMCPFCRKVVINKGYHLRKFHCEKLPKCLKCGRRFLTTGLMMAHLIKCV